MRREGERSVSDGDIKQGSIHPVFHYCILLMYDERRMIVTTSLFTPLPLPPPLSLFLSCHSLGSEGNVRDTQ